MKTMIFFGITLLMSLSTLCAQTGSLVFFPITDDPAEITTARFPGLKNYVKTHLKYPVPALEAETQGRVEAVAYIGVDGSVGDVSIIRSVSPSCDRAVVRMLQDMPAWVPATRNGQPVAQEVDIAVRFELQR